MATPILRAAGLALALLALGATACSSPLGSCGLIIVQFTPGDTVRVPVGTDAPVSAVTASSCPDQISRAVTFSTLDSTIATVRVIDSISAVVHGVKVDTTGLIAQSKDRTNIRSGIPIVVTP